MGELSKLCNIGKELEKQLNNIGINNYDELVNLGSQEAWLKIRKIDKAFCINKLMALEGAIQGIRWHKLAEEDKRYLREFCEKTSRDDLNN